MFLLFHQMIYLDQAKSLVVNVNTFAPTVGISFKSDDEKSIGK